MCTLSRPNDAELIFLDLAYNKFYDIYEEIFNDSFWNNTPYYRFSRIKDVFSIYSELLQYEPIKYVILETKTLRPPMESDISNELFRFIRNAFAHFPFFDCWDEVWINKKVVNWYKDGLSIDRFLKEYSGKKEVKYRFWEASKKQMTYMSITFPKEYNDKSKIYLKEILSEKDGIKFSMILMKKILDTQVVDS